MVQMTRPWIPAALLLLAGFGLAPAFGQPTDAIDTIRVEQQHLSKGELLYGNKWVHITDLFEEYCAGRKDGEAIIDKGRAVIAHLNELKQQVIRARAAEDARQRPTRDELTTARARLAECKRILAMPLPAEPKPSTIPPEPEATAFSDPDAFNKAHKDWEQKRATADRDLQRRRQQYERDTQRTRQNQAQASKDVKTAEETVARCEKTLQEMVAAFQAAQTPVLKQHADASEEAQAIGAQAQKLLSQMTTMGDILRRAPEGLRLQYGILEWESLFRPLADVESVYEKTKAEVEEGRAKARADASAKGQTLAADWHHPKEKNLEPLRLMIAHCKDAQATPVYPPKGQAAKDTPKSPPPKTDPLKTEPSKTEPPKK